MKNRFVISARMNIRDLLARLVADCNDAALTPDRKWLAVLIRPEDAQLIRKALEEYDED